MISRTFGKSLQFGYFSLIICDTINFFYYSTYLEILRFSDSCTAYKKHKMGARQVCKNIRHDEIALKITSKCSFTCADSSHGQAMTIS